MSSISVGSLRTTANKGGTGPENVHAIGQNVHAHEMSKTFAESKTFCAVLKNVSVLTLEMGCFCGGP